VPALHVLCVGAQVGAGVEETVIEVEVEMIRAKPHALLLQSSRSQVHLPAIKGAIAVPSGPLCLKPTDTTICRKRHRKRVRSSNCPPTLVPACDTTPRKRVARPRLR
jgi:hypothetical protein